MISNTETVISAVLGAFGGLIATFGAKYAWRRYMRPKLSNQNGIMSIERGFNEESFKQEKYKFKVKNEGKSVATNCRPQVRLVGRRDEVEKVPHRTKNGIKFDEVNTEKKYVIDIIPDWERSKDSATTDLNRGDIAIFNLFSSYFNRHDPVEPTLKIRFRKQNLKEESEDRWGHEPIRIETHGHPTSSGPIVEFEAEIEKDEFEEINWQEKYVMVTSANADRIKKDLIFEWDSKLPDISVL